MKLVVGLGNPGEKYKNNRHNAGFLVADQLGGADGWQISKSTGALIKWTDIGETQIELVKPQGFMNRSGAVVKGIFKKHPKMQLKEMFVVFDDLDIKLGEYKILFGKGPKDHNGLKSVYEQIGTKEFWHVRVGIDNGEFRQNGEKYVLSNWSSEEKKVISQVLVKIAEELKHVFD